MAAEAGRVAGEVDGTQKRGKLEEEEGGDGLGGGAVDKMTLLFIRLFVTS